MSAGHFCMAFDRLLVLYMADHLLPPGRVEHVVWFAAVVNCPRNPFVCGDPDV